MTTFYRGPDVLITDQIFLVRGPYALRFRIELLQQARVVTPAPQPMRRFAGVAAMAVPIAVTCSWPWMHGWEHLAGLAAAFAPSALYGCFRLTPCTRELRATYGRHDVSLFRTTDPILFGQIQRGLSRALDCRRDREENSY